jgi:hypothetical protein
VTATGAVGGAGWASIEASRGVEPWETAGVQEEELPNSAAALGSCRPAFVACKPWQNGVVFALVVFVMMNLALVTEWRFGGRVAHNSDLPSIGQLAVEA